MNNSSMNNSQRMSKTRNTKNIFAELFANDNMAQTQPMSKPADNMRNTDNQNNKQSNNRHDNESAYQSNAVQNRTEQNRPNNPKRKSKTRSTSNSGKKHYFIGAKLSKNLSKKLRKIYNSVAHQKGNFKMHHSQRVYHTRFVYLGYMTETDAELFINYINPLLVSIARKFSELEATFTGYQIKPKSGYKRVSISYENEKVKKIVKYLRKYVNKILEYPMSERYDPHVNLFTVKGNIIESKLNNEMIPQYFKINSIDIIAGTPTEKRSGMPSKHDTMNIEIHRSIPLVG